MFFGGIKIIFRKLHLGGNVSLLVCVIAHTSFDSF
jgi:hypothetical protein